MEIAKNKVNTISSEYDVCGRLDLRNKTINKTRIENKTVPIIRVSVPVVIAEEEDIEEPPIYEDEPINEEGIDSDDDLVEIQQDNQNKQEQTKDTKNVTNIIKDLFKEKSTDKLIEVNIIEKKNEKDLAVKLKMNVETTLSKLITKSLVNDYIYWKKIG